MRRDFLGSNRPDLSMIGGGEPFSSAASGCGLPVCVVVGVLDHLFPVVDPAVVVLRRSRSWAPIFSRTCSRLWYRSRTGGRGGGWGSAWAVSWPKESRKLNSVQKEGAVVVEVVVRTIRLLSPSEVRVTSPVYPLLALPMPVRRIEAWFGYAVQSGQWEQRFDGLR